MTSSGKVSLLYHASAACRGCPPPSMNF